MSLKLAELQHQSSALRDIGKAPKARRAAAAISMVLISVVSIAGCTSTGTAKAGNRISPLPDYSLTPQGWSPVTVGNLQISVPGTWQVETSGSCFVGGDGTVEVARTLNAPCTAPKTDNLQISTTYTSVSIAPNELVKPTGAKKVSINGIPVFKGRYPQDQSATLVEALGSELLVKGPETSKVIATVTHSPESVVLSSVVSRSPRGWASYSFGGISITVPKNWAHSQGGIGNGCYPGPVESTLQLDNDPSTYSHSCPPPNVRAGYLHAPLGLIVAVAHDGENRRSGSVCSKRGSLSICVDPTPFISGDPNQPRFASPGESDLLTGQILVGGKPKFLDIALGLGGNPVTAVSVFDSIKQG